MFKYNFKNLIFTDSVTRSRYISFITAIFAVVYHFAFLLTFYFINVKEMAYFNIGSVILFVFLTFYSKFHLKTSFLISYIEVILHQIFADYYIGITSSFHFLIVIIGVLPFLIFNKKIYRSLILSVISIIIFVLIHYFDYYFTGYYEVNPVAVTVIKVINISVSLFVIIGLVFLFTQIVINNETILTSEIDKAKKELNLQSHKVIQIQNNTIVRLANLVENRDSDTGLHVKRTRAYVRIIAKKAKEKHIYPEITDDYISLLYKAAPMHDIGKIVVSDVILKKPGKLTDEEFGEMKRHTTEGKRIINQILFDQEDKNYLKIAKEIAECHHEKWDGTGYPNNYKGENIPLSARIMAIADVYDALVSPRCYKEPFTEEKAFSIIEEGIGTHFDPELGKLFVEIKDEISSIKF